MKCSRIEYNLLQGNSQAERNSRAPAVPLLLLGVEDALEVAREEIHEDMVGIHGVITPELPLESLRHGLTLRPFRHHRPAKATEARGNTRDGRDGKNGTIMTPVYRFQII